jgi:CRISPR-associated endonuclease/helicase Cas3
MALYPYQEKVKTLIQSGQSVILQAPTGAGKTRAAIAPFIEAFFDFPADQFPKKCIYSVPLRVLANQFEAEYRELAETYQRKHRREIKVAIQTGDRPDDRQFQDDLIFATIDQTLSSFVHMPYSLPRKLANLNAGAVVASYLVFDEFHLFESASTLPTTLEMLHMLRGVAPFILMTATFSSQMLQTLGEWLNATVIPGNEIERQELLNLPVEKSKTRFYHWQPMPMTAETILTHHQGHTRSLVVCNVVDRAQQIYRDLRDHPKRGNTEIILLHSRFLAEDRAAKEKELLAKFGKNADRKAGSVIAVATQVIEVGVDISAEVLHTELAPANAILQRAGRCARYANEVGHVYVYPVENYFPYASDKGDSKKRAVIEQTQAWLETHPEDEPINFVQEQAWVDAAHTEFDREMLKALRASASEHRQRIEAALTGNRAEAGEIIRKVVSQPITLSAQPDRWLARPFDMPLFSLHPGTLMGAAKAWLQGDGGAGRLKKLVELEGNEQDYAVSYRWQPIETTKQLIGAPLIVIHPDLASYNSDEGLMLKQGGLYWDETALLAKAATSATRASWSVSYKLESYYRHIELVYREFERMSWPELRRAAVALEKRAGWPPGTMTRAAALTVLFHDVGKLTATSNGKRGWQAWADTWQKKIGGATLDFYAHTDYDSTNKEHLRIEAEMGRRPSHALESAIAIVPLLAAAFNPAQEKEIIKAIFSAIARHHGAFTERSSHFQLVRNAPIAIQQTIPLAGNHAAKLLSNKILMSGKPLSLKERDLFFVDGSNDDELLAYMILARALRLADQAGTTEGAK